MTINKNRKTKDNEKDKEEEGKFRGGIGEWGESEGKVGRKRRGLG